MNSSMAYANATNMTDAIVINQAFRLIQITADGVSELTGILASSRSDSFFELACLRGLVLMLWGILLMMFVTYHVTDIIRAFRGWLATRAGEVLHYFTATAQSNLTWLRTLLSQ